MQSKQIFIFNPEHDLSAVLKSPLSGSGKGIRFVRERLSESDEGWCRRILDKQGSVIVERRFEIIKECAKRSYSW